MKPLGIDAAVKALAHTRETSAAQRQLELALQQARFEAAHARRQYDLVDSANRLVAGELERRWNEALQAVHRIEGEIAVLEARRPAPLGEKEREHIMQFGADLELAWSHPAATAATRKGILRAILHEIVVRIDDGFIEMILHWQGGDHTALKLKMNGAGKHRWTIPEDTLTLIRKPYPCRSRLMLPGGRVIQPCRAPAANVGTMTCGADLPLEPGLSPPTRRQRL